VEKARAAFDPIVGLDASLGSRKVLPEQIIGVGGALLTQSLTIALTEIAPYLQQKTITGAGYEIRFLNTREDISGNLRTVIPDQPTRVVLSSYFGNHCCEILALR
jgi:hypothetical protein